MRAQARWRSRNVECGMWNVECAGSPWNSRNTERDSTNSKFRIPNSQLHDSPSGAYRLLRDRPHRRDNVPGRDTGPIEQFFRLPAARDLADRETVHDHAGIGHGRRHGVADAARCVMVLDGEQLAASGAAGGDERVAVDRRDRIEIDDADGD